MGAFTVEDWAKEWLDAKRKEGETCLEIKVSNGNHYVYRSTTHYDKDSKRPKKDSVYVGTLKSVDGKAVYTPKRKNNRVREASRSILEAGPLRLLDACAGEIPGHLEHRFPDEWDSLYALALLRCIRPVSMKSAADLLEKYELVRGMKPPMSPKTLSEVLKNVGAERDSQLLFFRDTVPPGTGIAFDLTEFFSTSGELTLSEKGRNPEHDDRNQVNIAMACSLGTGEPSYVRAIPGSVRDIKTVCSSIAEMRMKDVIIVGDRGFYSKENVEVIEDSGMKYVFPVKRNSTFYNDVAIGETDFFFWNEKVIRYGKSRLEDGTFLYRFSNDEMAVSEDRNALKKMKDGKLTVDQYSDMKDRMGHMIIVSDLDRGPEDIYHLYKCRDRVEKRFRTLFSIMESDSTYMRDNDRLRGHFFVSYLSLKILSRLESRIRDAGLLGDMSVEDVILAYSKAYAVVTEGETIDYEVPKKLEDLDSELGFNIFPILRS